MSDTTNTTQPTTQPVVTDKVERAEMAVKKMAEFEQRIDEKIAKLEHLKSEAILGGKTEAGNPEVKKELTAKEYANEFMRGKIKPI